jgi:hypothetical protein
MCGPLSKRFAWSINGFFSRKRTQNYRNSRWTSLFMNRSLDHRFSGPVTIFHERVLPEKATPAGYAALVDAYGVAGSSAAHNLCYRRTP